MDADILAQLEDLKWQVTALQKKCKQYAEEVVELRGDLHVTSIENEDLQEKLRLGIKRGDVYIRDNQGNTTNKIPCILEIHNKIAVGTSRTAYNYTLLSADFDEEDNFTTSVIERLTCGVIKYYNLETFKDKRQLLETDCLKLWYLTDLAAEFNRKFNRRLLSFVNCAKIELDTGEFCMLEPCLEDFDRACNNDGDGWENLDDRLGAFAHFVFEKTNKKFLPCDFQGDLTKMILTDPEINCCDNTEEFNGVPTRGRVGTFNCLSKHLVTCVDNKFCNFLNLKCVL